MVLIPYPLLFPKPSSALTITRGKYYILKFTLCYILKIIFWGRFSCKACLSNKKTRTEKEKQGVEKENKRMET